MCVFFRYLFIPGGIQPNNSSSNAEVGGSPDSRELVDFVRVHLIGHSFSIQRDGSVIIGQWSYHLPSSTTFGSSSIGLPSKRSTVSQFFNVSLLIEDGWHVHFQSKVCFDQNFNTSRHNKI